MSNSKHTKVLLAALIILVLLNLACLYSIWTARQRTYPPCGERMMGRGGPKAYIIKELGFNERQIREYDVLVDEHRHIMMTTHDQIRLLKKRLYSMLSKPDVSRSDVDEISQMIGERITYLEEETFDHFQKVRALCNDRQKEKFDQIIGKVIDMMSSHGPPLPPPALPPPPRFDR